MIIVSVSQFQAYLVGTFSVIVKTNGFAALHKLRVHASDSMSQCLLVLALLVSAVMAASVQTPECRVSDEMIPAPCCRLSADLPHSLHPSHNCLFTVVLLCVWFW